jgi:salicylate hydroxylase
MGPQGKIVVNHKALKVDAEKDSIKFENGNTTTADLIIAADGICVSLQQQMDDRETLIDFSSH